MSTTVNRQAKTLAANDNAKFVVNAGDGADPVDAGALAVARLLGAHRQRRQRRRSAHGRIGRRHVLGDGGNDRVVGFRGDDDL